MNSIDHPAFVVGVTGNMDPVPRAGVPQDQRFEHLKEPVRVFFRFLRGEPGAKEHFRKLLAHRDFSQGLEDWPGIDDRTPILVLTSLAPGADTLVAQVTLESEFQQRNFKVQAPLPFPADLYPRASTFQSKRNFPEENAQNVTVFENLIRELSVADPESAFAVLLAEDVPKSDAERRSQFDADLLESTRSELRYQAAGEYVAAQGDVLLTLWDDDHGPAPAEGTGGIVEAKRRGLQSELLPESTAFTWADVGPVVHVHLRRKKSEDESIAGHPDREGRIRLLHAYVSGPASTAQRSRLAYSWGPAPGDPIEDQRAFRRWQRDGGERFTRIAALLAEFNRTGPVPADEIEKELQERMAGCGEPICQANSAITADLRRLAALRVQSNRESQALNAWKRRIVRRLFLLTFAAAVLMHLFAHWHPPTKKSTEADAAGPVITPANASEPALAGQSEESYETVRRWCASGALAFAGFGLWVFVRQRSQRIEERAYDYRALSEGARIQFHWCLAGLGRSVAANYMQRQHGELDWIRSAISSLAAPYPRWFDWFRELGPNLQLAALKCVHQGWIQEQARYFSYSSKRRRDSLHCAHKLGGAIALAGLAHVPVHIAGTWPGAWNPLDDHTIAWGKIAGGFAALLTLVAGSLIAFVWGKCARELRGFDKDVRWPKILHWSAVKGASLLVPPAHAEVRLERADRRRSLILAFLGQLPLSLAILAIALGADARAAMWAHWPAVHDLAVISMGFCFVAGALTVAWAERNLFSEEAYQYNAMAGLFSNGNSRMEGLIAELERLRSDPAKFAHKVKQAQSLILALGREALDENAEWLILHRARPLEPVMAG